MSRTDPQLKLRLPEKLKAAVTEAAKENHRSVNAEIVARLEESFAVRSAGDEAWLRRHSADSPLSPEEVEMIETLFSQLIMRRSRKP